MKNKKALIACLAALVVIAAVLLIWQPWKKTETPAAAPAVVEEAKEKAEEAKEAVKDAAEEGKAAVEGAAEEVKEAAEGAAEEVKETVEEAKEAVEGAAEEVKETVEGAVEGAKETVEEAAAAAAGTAAETAAEPAAEAKVKLGVILLHDEDSTYDLNFINGVKDAQKALGLSDDDVIIKRNIPESNECYEAAKDLVDEGCTIVFADSFGHESFMLQAAKDFPNVEFCHATGTSAHVEKLANFHNAFAAIYEGRYLAGIAAGMKLNELKEAGKLKGEKPLMGYVGAFTYAEVVSGYTSFYLGAKSVCPDVQMKVQFTGSWYDEKEEKAAAEALIAAGADLISQHADSMGAPTACENAGIPDVSYNGSTVESCPNTFIVASRIDWAPYFEYIVNQKKNGQAIDTDWTGTIATGSVVLTEVNEKAAAKGTQEAIDAKKAEFAAGTAHVYDTASEGFITVGGAAMAEDWKPGEGTDAAFVEGTKIVYDGYFHESEYRSAPYFDAGIDGIELLNQKF